MCMMSHESSLVFRLAHAGSSAEFSAGLEKLKKLIQNGSELPRSVLFGLNVMLSNCRIVISIEDNVTL